MRINMNLNNRNNDLRSDTNRNNISFPLNGRQTAKNYYSYSWHGRLRLNEHESHESTRIDNKHTN